ncbi:hypothetical protein CRM22_004845 [Opisthorchis felineus]|uniref:Uncharacterized protein n=1 Tax=Opisthorchis felineus TaxID=147828 RepID=A0A4V3SF77_OPIFE|nr:hypothetical protein CRM22_004845 [Opisthorchis felineus]
MIVDSSTAGETDPNFYASRLRQYMHDIRPPLTRQTSKPTQVHPDRATRYFVFMRVNAVRKPSQPTCEIPFRVISRKGKPFVIDRNGLWDTFAIERLKVADVHIQPTLDDEHTNYPSVTQSHSRTIILSTNTLHTPLLSRSGQHHRFPVRFKN